MSYSRWGGSRWYTMWQICPDGTPLDEQLFAIVGEGLVFSYIDLKTNITNCLKYVETTVEKVTKSEIDELAEYMKQFVNDVEHDPEFLLKIDLIV